MKKLTSKDLLLRTIATIIGFIVLWRVNWEIAAGIWLVLYSCKGITQD